MEELGLPTRITNLPVSPSPSVFLKDFGTLGWFLSVWLLTFWQCCLNQGAIFTIQTDSKAVYEEVRKLLIMAPVWVVDWLVLMEMCMKYTVSQCRHWLKLWRRYFHSFGTDTRFCSPTPAWQSYFMSDFSYFFLIVLSQCSNPQSAKYSRAHTSDIQTAPWPWAGTHTHTLPWIRATLFHFLLIQDFWVTQLLMKNMHWASELWISCFVGFRVFGERLASPSR